MEDIIQKFNLPPYIKGKSFADASKLIQDKFKDRADNTSKNTMMELLTRLKDAQEYVKSIEEQSANEFMYGGKSNKYFLGGEIDPTDPKNTKTPKATFPDNPNDLIASFKSKKEAKEYINPYPKRSNRWNVFNTFQKKLKNSSFGTASKGVMGKRAPSFPGVDPSVTFNGTSMRVSEIEKILKDKGETPDNIAEVIAAAMSDSNDMMEGGFLSDVDMGGYMGAANGLFQAGNNIFGDPNIDMSGNTQYQQTTGAGDALGGAMSGAQAGMAFGPWGAAVGGVLGGVGSLIGGNKRRKKIMQAETNKAHRNQNEALQQFDKGGKMESGKYDFLKDIGTDILRAAPIATNLGQLLSMDKPVKENLAKLDNRYERQYTDEAALVNQINDSFNMNYLTEGSQGKSGAFMSNARAAQLAKTKAVSDAYMKSRELNNQEDRNAQRFDLNVDQFNANVMHRESENYARDIGAYETNKSRLISQLGNDAGDLGKEFSRDEMIKEMFDYNRKGKFIGGKQLPRVQSLNLDPLDIDTSIFDNIKPNLELNLNKKGGYLDDVFNYMAKNYSKRLKK